MKNGLKEMLGGIGTALAFTGILYFAGQCSRKIEAEEQRKTSEQIKYESGNTSSSQAHNYLSLMLD